MLLRYFEADFFARLLFFGLWNPVKISKDPFLYQFFIIGIKCLRKQVSPVIIVIEKLTLRPRFSKKFSLTTNASLGTLHMNIHMYSNDEGMESEGGSSSKRKGHLQIHFRYATYTYHFVLSRVVSSIPKFSNSFERLCEWNVLWDSKTATFSLQSDSPHDSHSLSIPSCAICKYVNRQKAAATS